MNLPPHQRRPRQLRQPKYLQIYDDLAQSIRTGQHPPDKPLPSQRELSQRYGVTIMTLRQALQLLEDEGLVETRHGSGTFVAGPRYAYDLGHLRSFAQDMAVAGAAVQTQVVSAKLVPAPATVAARLGLPQGGRAYAVRRLRSIDGRPVVLQDSYLPPALGRRLRSADLESQSLYDVLETQHDLAVARAIESIRPVVLAPADAVLLGREPGAPALSSYRLSLDRDDRPVIDDLALLAGDAVEITATRNAEALQLSYALSPARPE